MSKEKESFLKKIIKESPDKIGDLQKTDNNLYGNSEGEYFKKNLAREGQLAVDVYETSSAIVVKSIIGGVKATDIDISISNDVLTIKGVRKKQEETDEVANYFVSECFWGPFSRSIILPVSVDADNIRASLKDGVLKIELLKLSGAGKVKKIAIKEE